MEETHGVVDDLSKEISADAPQDKEETREEILSRHRCRIFLYFVIHTILKFYILLVVVVLHECYSLSLTV